MGENKKLARFCDFVAMFAHVTRRQCRVNVKINLVLQSIRTPRKLSIVNGSFKVLIEASSLIRFC